MIYGYISKFISEVQENQLKHLKEYIKWGSCIHREIEWGDFKGGFLYDKNLPYSNEDFLYFDPLNNLMILLSGAIYNRKIICESLNLDENELPDPQLIYKAYDYYGDDFINELNGDFTILIYEKHTGSFILARDHVGVRPITYNYNNNSFWFSSDGLCLSRALNQKGNISPTFLLNQLIYFGLSSSSLLPERTILPNSNVKKIPPGTFVSVHKTNFLLKKYWFPENVKEDNNLNFIEALKEAKYLLNNSVKIRCSAKFKASTHLSSGLDSGTIASLVRKEYATQEEFLGFCWTSHEDQLVEKIEYDERELVKKLAYQLNIQPVFTAIDPHFQIQCLSDWRLITDTLYENRVRENAKKLGSNLIFSGWGGDDFISIYDTGIDSDLLLKFQWKLFVKRNPLKNPKRIISVLIFNVILPFFSLRYFSVYKSLSHYCKYLESYKKFKVKTINTLFNWRSRRGMHLNYLNNQHIPERTEEWSILGMRNGIEYRYPLIDKRIIEFMLKVPSKILVNEKYSRVLFRELGKGLIPEEIRLNTSKNDPVRFQAFSKMADETCLLLMDQIEEFRNNDNLSFINFDLLANDINSFKNSSVKKSPFENFEILFYLKKIHEFSKTYSEF